MEISLSWDLLLGILFVVFFVYGFLLGQHDTIKFILGIYTAVLISDTLASLLYKFFTLWSAEFQDFLNSYEDLMFILTRIIVLLVIILVFVLKSGIKITISAHENSALQFAIHSLFSALSSVLILSTSLIYLAGNSFAEGIQSAKKLNLYNDSYFGQILIDYYQIWFALPLFCFLMISVIFKTDEI